jgi:Xaa-Pro aminopeptidase
MTSSHFTARFFAHNRARLRRHFESQLPIVVTGNGLMQRTGDTNYPFRQDSNFWYLTGINEPNLMLVIDEADEYLIVPTQVSSQAAFDGARNHEQLRQRSGISKILNPAEGYKDLRNRLLHTKQAATCLPAKPFDTWHGMYISPARHRLTAKLRRISPGITLHDLRPQLAAMRCIKQPPELHAIQQAIDITCATIDDIRVASILKSYSAEYELEAAITTGFRKRGATGHAWPPIIAAGTNTTIIHSMANNAPIRAGDSIIIDIGAEVENYTADISRTISARPLKGRHLDVFTAAKTVQNQALALLKPGDYRAYERQVAMLMGAQLKRLGLITNATDVDGIRRYFPTATSHFMGLDVHDVGDYRAPLAPGMVLTCEPGIYIPEEGIGVRIEDDVLLTSNGNRLLSQHCSQDAYVAA